jgi:hypothetical protein
MTIDIKKFAELQKASKESFFQQKQLVKQVIAGKKVNCNVCNLPLMLILPKKDRNENQIEGIRCAKGCTDIQLDFV